MPRETKPQTFEQLYARLEETVAKIEAGGLPLEETIALYEQGMTLAKECQDRLDDAEQKVTKLRESFATLPARTNGAVLNEAPPDDYEYVAEGDDPAQEAPFD